MNFEEIDERLVDISYPATCFSGFGANQIIITESLVGTCVELVFSDSERFNNLATTVKGGLLDKYKDFSKYALGKDIENQKVFSFPNGIKLTMTLIQLAEM